MIEVWTSAGVTVARTRVGTRVFVCAGAPSAYGWNITQTPSGRAVRLASKPREIIGVVRALELARAFALLSV